MADKRLRWASRSACSAIVTPAAPVDVTLVLWGAIEKGGVPFLLFLASGWLFKQMRSQAEQILKLQQERYTENDARWAERFREEKARSDRLELLLGQQNLAAQRIVTVAERVLPPPPPGAAAGRSPRRRCPAPRWARWRWPRPAPASGRRTCGARRVRRRPG